MKSRTLSTAIGATIALSVAGLAQAATEVHWWHAMGRARSLKFY